MGIPIHPDELAKRFKYHRPSGEAKEMHEDLREKVMEFAGYMSVLGGTDEMTREKALAFTAFEEASFWMHAHIARNGPHEEQD